MMDQRLKMVAGVAVVLVMICLPAWAYYDHGGRFSRAAIVAPAVPTPTPPAELESWDDEVAYITSHGNGRDHNDGSVWAFWKRSRCIDPNAAYPQATPTATAVPYCNRTNGCGSGEVCTPLWWTFSVANPVEIMKNGSVKKVKLTERGRILGYPVVSADGQTVYITSDNGYVYALPARPSLDCIEYGYMGAKPTPSPKPVPTPSSTSGPTPTPSPSPVPYERVPKLKRECIKWQFNTRTQLRAAVGEDKETKTVYVGSMTKRNPLPSPYPQAPTGRQGTLWAFEEKGCCQDPNPEATPSGVVYGKASFSTSCTPCDRNKDCSDPAAPACIGQVPDDWPAYTLGNKLRFQPMVHRLPSGTSPTPIPPADVAIYVGSALPDGGLTAFDGAGNEIWTWDQSSRGEEEEAAYPLGGVVSADGNVLYANSDDFVLALNLVGGNSTPPGARGQNGVSLKWRHKEALNRKTFTRQSPILFKDTGSAGADLGVYQAHRVPGAMLKIDQNCRLDWDFSVGRGGRISWSTPAEGPVFGSSHRIISGSHGTKGCLFGLEDGATSADRKKWDFRPTLSSASFFTSGAVSADTGLLYMGTNDGVFYELDTLEACTDGNCNDVDNSNRVKWCYDIWDPLNPNKMDRDGVPPDLSTQQCWPDPGPSPTPAAVLNNCAIETPDPKRSPCCVCPGVAIEQKRICSDATVPDPCATP